VNDVWLGAIVGGLSSLRVRPTTSAFLVESTARVRGLAVSILNRADQVARLT
jgi:hypothetical protein